MIDIAVTRLSSRGQVVIPLEMRRGFRTGEKLLLIRNKNRLIMKRASALGANIAEDLEFARRTEASFKRYELGLFKEMSKEDFLEELKKW